MKELGPVGGGGTVAGVAPWIRNCVWTINYKKYRLLLQVLINFCNFEMFYQTETKW